MIDLESISSLYLWVKTFHVIGAAVLLGVGFGSAFFKWQIDRTGTLPAIVSSSRTVVVVDKIFTLPAIGLQLATGITMVRLGDYTMTEAWLVLAIGFFILTGLCWIPAVYIQLRCRDMAVQASLAGTELPADYRRLSRIWFWLGVAGFTSVWILVGLMVMKPGWA
ncbi:MAG: DUF2269 domain-containing protein [Nitrospira sp.]|nr:DUF2269 domain-containing protein [Nitrospira sp.]